MSHELEEALKRITEPLREQEADLERKIRRLGDGPIDELELAKRIEREWRQEWEAEEDEWSPAAFRQRRAAAIEVAQGRWQKRTQ